MGMYDNIPAGLHIESGYTDNLPVDKRTIRGSWNYVMTAHTGSASDMLEIENIRKAVRIINKMSDKKFRVELRGRYGKKNPNYNAYRAKIGSVPLADAERIDVYVYER
tara:strand:- start:719 stop:1042 length:324 start_codon:yes stop_codon:yes gene_type:complete